VSRLGDDLRRRLWAAADPAKAPAMQAYMKSAMPYFGVQTTPLRAVCREAFAGLAFSDGESWRRAVLEIWRGAEYREERYAAIELVKHRSARVFLRLDAVPMLREMIVSGAWWDFVDAIAGGPLYRVLENDREAMAALLRQWARGDDLWLRRSAIIAQLHAKAETDLTLLYDCIEPSLGSPEFFLRKAIGWALRQYARTDPAEAARYVAANEARLSPLSRREALKHIA
jgi:3-methyladenine DNA glycosylase AlkD